MSGFGIDVLAFEVNLCQVFKLRGVDFEIAKDQIPHFGVRAFTVAIHFCISGFSIAFGLPLPVLLARTPITAINLAAREVTPVFSGTVITVMPLDEQSQLAKF